MTAEYHPESAVEPQKVAEAEAVAVEVITCELGRVEPLEIRPEDDQRKIKLLAQLKQQRCQASFSANSNHLNVHKCSPHCAMNQAAH